MRLSELSIISVWTALGGGELRGNRGRAFWRNGDGWNVAVDAEKNAWFDHRGPRGGGVLDFVKVVLGCDRAAALAWLEMHCGLDATRPLSHGERRARADAAGVAEQAHCFGIAASALSATILEQLQCDDPERGSYERLRQIVRRGGPALVEEYTAWLDQYPLLTASMVRAGKASDARIQRNLAFYIREVA